VSTPLTAAHPPTAPAPPLAPSRATPPESTVGGPAPDVSTVPAEAEAGRPLVVGLGGTLRPGASSERALRVSLDAAREAGAETVLLPAVELVLPMYDPARPERSHEARRLIELLVRCDGVIVASPSYHGGISGLLKNALDHVEDLREDARPYLDGRAVGCVAVGGGAQGANATLTALRTTVHALRGWPTPFGVAVGGPLAEDADPVRAQLRRVGEQVASFALLTRAAASARSATLA
jgi:FMN reductase